MQAYDLIMLIVLAMATIFGAIKGFAWQVASIASVIVSYFVAYRFRFDVAEMIQATPPWNQFLAMLILYVGTSFVIWVGFRLLSGMIDRVRLKEFDRHLGAGFGFFKGLIYCLLITMFAMSLLGQNQQRAICQSRSGYYIATALDKGVGILPREIHDVVGPYLAKLDGKLKHGQQGQDQPSLENPSLGNLLQNGLPSMPDGFSDALQSIPFPSGQNQNLAPPQDLFPPQNRQGGYPQFPSSSQYAPAGTQPAGAGTQGGRNSVGGLRYPANSLRSTRPTEQARQQGSIVPR